MFKPTYYWPTLEMTEKRPAAKISASLWDGVSVNEGKRSKTLEDIDFEAMIVHVEGNDNRPSSLSERESLSNDYFGILKRSNKEDRVWVNGNAKLLKSMWDEEMKQEDGDRDCMYFDFVRDIVKKDCLCHVCKTSSVEEYCESLLIAAKSVVQLTEYGITYVDMSMFEDRLSSHTHDSVCDALFFAVARAVLSIFDMEDFKKIHNREEVPKELNLNFDSREALAEGKATYDNDSHRVDVRQPGIYAAIEVIEKYEPLKEYYKKELLLELLHKKCFHVFDTLVIKTVVSIPLKSLLGSVAHKEEHYRGKYYDKMKEVEFNRFIEGVTKCLLRLGAIKSVLEGQTWDDESTSMADEEEVWQNPVWKDKDILSILNLEWTSSGEEAKLMCPIKDFFRPYPRDADPRAFLQTWDKAENEGTEEDKKTLMIAKSVATSTLHIMNATYLLCDLKIALSEKEYRGFFLSVFGCLSNVVFSLLDMDDFVMICDGSRWLEEYKKFCSDLNSEESVASQKVEGNTFSVLREHDLFCALKGLQGTDEDSGCEELLWGCSGPFMAKPNDDIIEVAEAVIKRCRALKRDERMRLSLEMMLNKQYIVYDTLVLRALCGMVTGELHYGSEAAETVSLFMRRLVSQLSYMMDTKSRRMKRLETALTFPLLDKSIFGPCNKEVVELIKFADFERRMRNERFITSKDVLFCLSLTRVGPSVKLLLLKRRPYKDLSLFMLYKRSREMAGSGNDMMLDHLVMALFGEEYKQVVAREAHPPDEAVVLNSAAWDGDLQGRLGLSGYEQRDVKIWNSFSKSWFDSDKLAACSSHEWILGKRAGMYECDFGLYARR